MTATLDLLEHRGWIRRVPNPGDRRSTLIEITPDGRAATGQLLPGIRTLEKNILSALTPGERAQLLDLLAKILARAAEVAAGPPEPLTGQRLRPARLEPMTMRAGHWTSLAGLVISAIGFSVAVKELIRIAHALEADQASHRTAYHT